jgi:ABC-type enterochelin transport system substrate-binding protein
MTEELDFGFGMKKTNVSDYSEYVGNYVKIYSNNNTFYGKMIESDFNGFTKLNPSLIDYSSPSNTQAKIETKLPTTINTSSINSIQPVTRNLLEDICSGLKEAKGEKENE